MPKRTYSETFQKEHRDIVQAIRGGAVAPARAAMRRHLLNSRIKPGESIRVFPLSNWTEIDVWQYIHLENIPVVPLYFAKEREVIVRGEALIMVEQPFVRLLGDERPQKVMCRMRSLGCSPCTGAVRSTAVTVPRKTTSSACRPGHFPGSTSEHVHPRVAIEIAGISSRQTSRGRQSIANILHFFPRDAKPLRTLLHSLPR